MLSTALAMLRQHAARSPARRCCSFVPLALVRHVAHEYLDDLQSETFTPYVGLAVLVVLAGSALAVLGP